MLKCETLIKRKTKGMHISDVGSNMSLGRSVKISGLGLVLPGLLMRYSPTYLASKQVIHYKFSYFGRNNVTVDIPIQIQIYIGSFSILGPPKTKFSWRKGKSRLLR